MSAYCRNFAFLRPAQSVRFLVGAAPGNVTVSVDG